MITGRENLQQIADTKSELIPVLDKHGLGSYFKPENLAKIGRFTRLNTLLKSKKIDPGTFIKTLNQQLREAEDNHTDVTVFQENLHFTAMLPCGLRNPFKEFAESYLQDQQETFSYLNYLIEGNVNHELSYYPLLDNMKDAEELPDMIMASDVNNFFHRPFIERFIKKGIFKAYEPHVPHVYLEKAGYSDPEKNYTMFSANMLVIAVDKEKLNGRKMPEKWDDLLDPMFDNDIIMRGEDDFFCNAVMLPFFKDKGYPAIHRLARNIKTGMHPAEMVKLAGKNRDEGAAIYILPYFFSKRIKSKKVEIVWPSDGAIASPVFLLVKKDKLEKHKPLLDFLLGKEVGQMLEGRYFPSTHPDIGNQAFPEQVKWLGWGFLKQHDIGHLKDEIRNEFMKIWRRKEGGA